jgi:hypothetical protein
MTDMSNNFSAGQSPAAGVPRGSTAAMVFVAWLFVTLPTAWGVYNTVKTATQLFRSSGSAPAAQVVQK